MPEISVLMGIYNEKNRKHAAQAVDSILNQTLADFEFIICDDGSNQSFYQWLQDYCRKDCRIILVRSQKNRGLASALNKCLALASGRYLARMDADDISEPRRLEKQAAFLHRHREYALVGCSAYLISGQEIWGLRRLEKAPDKKSFLRTSPFIHPTVMLRREVMEQLHGYCELAGVRRVEDYEFFMRLYAAGYKGYNLPQPLFRYREEARSFQKRRWCGRINECRVRYRGFQALGISRGNLRHVVKPLAAGLVPDSMMWKFHKRKFAVRAGASRDCAREGWKQRDDRDRHIKL